MHLILCIDDRDGLAFGSRRLSSDREVCNHILQTVGGSRLWMNGYSAKLFPEGAVAVSDDIFEAAGEGEYVFCENVPIPEAIPSLESVTLYRWNRSYPSTLKFPWKLLQPMILTCREDFPGKSHDTITMERYCL